MSLLERLSVPLVSSQHEEPSDLSLEPATLTILFALTSALTFALSIQMQNVGLQYTDPQTGAMISIVATLVFYLPFAPFWIESHFWFTKATLLFGLVGLMLPAMSSTLSATGVKILGPTLTSGLAATSPIFAIIFGILLLGEAINANNLFGTLFVVTGIGIAALNPRGLKRSWPLWAMALPFGAALIRASGQAVTKIGLLDVPSSFFASFVAFITSTIVAVLAFVARGKRFPPLSTRLNGFIYSGIFNGIGVLTLNAALKSGDLVLVAPIVSSSPVFAMLLGAFVFKRETISWRTVATILLVVPGVILVTMSG